MKIIDRCGRYLSSVVYRNIAVLIAVGILRILYSPAGWFPNPELYDLVKPLMAYLVPILFAYTGGKMIGEARGGIIAAFVTMAAIYGSGQEYPMILASLLIGPVMGYLIKQLDKWIEAYIPTGFELLLYNAVSAVVGVFFAILSYEFFGSMMEYFIHVIMLEMQTIIASGLLPFIAVVIEPAKVLFFNNIINHGILEPLGISQLKYGDTSIFFMLETNPGPGIGMLLALFWYSARQSRGDLKSAMTIQFLGGIHEVYFPYALRRPMLIIPLILGGICGNFIFYYFQTGLVATPSPGSILVYMVMVPKQFIPSVIFGIFISAAVSCCFSYLLLIFADKRQSHAGVKGSSYDLLASDFSTNISKPIKTIVFACDGGLASSAMGAAKLKKALSVKGLKDFKVLYTAIDRIPQEADLVIVSEYLKTRTVESAPHAIYRYVSSLIAPQVYEDIIRLLGPDEQISLFEEEGSGSEMDDLAVAALETRSLALNDRLVKKENKHREALHEDTPLNYQVERILLDGVEDSRDASLTMARSLIKLGFVKPSGIQPLLSSQVHTEWLTYGSVAVMTHFAEHPDSVSNPGVLIGELSSPVMMTSGNSISLIVAICTDAHCKEDLLSRMFGLLDDEAWRLKLADSPIEEIRLRLRG